MRAIFISYRREDAEGQAGRLFDDLARYFGEDTVFMDVAGIEPTRTSAARVCGDARKRWPAQNPKILN